ncbi:hypothetical protein HA502_27645 [Klebsiella pneumoniae]|uniref:hypothetical protein n=1 Tax=Klebsiella pneumoniae TaxID=573 RepID=UPI000C7A2E84|nr:hypothetical protein [Klebsiella pneumoniae]MDU9112484.1 hypothetical protein [Klebsiella pneumoniae]MDU9175046.1 hypothetical protein [Klebsiella pneumoniae]NIA42263.1 hypothetical protein [Klebsiella pneumoniae]PLJ08107.1 hypothetical protein B6J59_22345 [Klebsiella pneumoniae]
MSGFDVPGSPEDYFHTTTNTDGSPKYTANRAAIRAYAQASVDRLSDLSKQGENVYAASLDDTDKLTAFLHGIPEEAKIAIYNTLSQELEAITSAKNDEIAKINAETERLNATVAQKEMDLANIGSVIGAIVVVLVLFVLFINLK